MDIFSDLFKLFPVIIGSLFVLIIYVNLKRQAHFRKMNYKKYITENPQCLGNGRVSCCHCGGKQVHVRNLMNRTFFREHFCTQCGKTLYYSPERSL
jgi:hypothetical protein